MSNEQIPLNETSATLGAPIREKLWTECTPDEKLAALRKQLIYTTHRLDQLGRDLELLMNHTHVGDRLASFVARNTYSMDTVSPRQFYLPTGLRDKE